MKVFIIRIDDGKNRYWVAFDALRTMAGKLHESKQAILARWEKLAGSKVTVVVNYRGVMRPSEAAMTISGEQQQKETTQ